RHSLSSVTGRWLANVASSPAAIRAGTGATRAVSSTARRMFSGTGLDCCVSNDATIMVIEEQTIPMSIGSYPIPSVEPATSEITEAKVPTIIELMAPTVFAFFHHTAQI